MTPPNFYAIIFKNYLVNYIVLYLVDSNKLFIFASTIKHNIMTPFEKAQEDVKNGTINPPRVSLGAKEVNYFGYQLATHHFNLKIMAKGMSFKGVKFTDLKKYYGLKGKGAKDCLEQFEQIMNDYKSKLGQ